MAIPLIYIIYTISIIKLNVFVCKKKDNYIVHTTQFTRHYRQSSSWTESNCIARTLQARSYPYGEDRGEDQIWFGALHFFVQCPRDLGIYSTVLTNCLQQHLHNLLQGIEIKKKFTL